MYNEGIIPRDKYFEDLNKLQNILKHEDIDAIVAIKRSGFIMSAILSNFLEKPLYTTSEISTIPDKFKNILLVDDKICSSKTIRKYMYKLSQYNKNIISASIYIEKDFYTKFWVEETNKTVSMWYEKLK